MPAYDKVIGLDVGHSTVKVVLAQRAAKTLRVLRAETVRLPPEGTDKASAIHRWLTDLKLDRYPCVIGITGQSAMFQPLTVDEKDPRTFDQIAAVEINRFNELASEPTLYGFTPVRTSSGARRLLLCMARPAIVDAALAAAGGAGVEVVDIVPAPVALFNAVEALGLGSPEPYLAVDIGHGVTEVAVGNHEGLMFARSFAIGGQFFTQELAKGAAIPLRQAETAKEAVDSLARTEAKTQAALTRAADAWISEFQVCLSVLRNLFPNDKDRPARVLVSGGGASLGGLLPLLHDRLGMDVAAVQAPRSVAIPGDVSRFLVATGLAVSGLGMADSPISLLPPGLRDELLLKRQKKYWIAAAVVAAMILAVSVVGGYMDFKRMEKQLNVQRDSLRRCQDLARQIETTKGRNDLILSTATPILSMLKTSPLLRDLMALVADAKDADDWISLIADSRSYFSQADSAMPPAAPPPGAPPRGRGAVTAAGTPIAADSPFRRIIIEGYTTKADFTTVKHLISALQASSLVESADLLGDDELVKEPERDKRWSGGWMRRFVIDVKTVRQ